MGRPGRKTRLVLEDEYWALLASRVGTGDACRKLGIARKTVARGEGPQPEARREQADAWAYPGVMENEIPSPEGEMRAAAAN